MREKYCSESFQKTRAEAFDAQAANYDGWYDTPKGRAAFQEELHCLKVLKGNSPSPWLEIGVGTGRFAEALQIASGVDSSWEMLAIARKRKLLLTQGVAEALPFPSTTFQGILINTALCFMEDPKKALRESLRLLRPHGMLLLGIVPADGLWGQQWQKAAESGHPLYSQVHFRSAAESVALVESCGYHLQEAMSALFRSPDKLLKAAMSDIRSGITPEAGFLALRFEVMH